MDAAGMPGILAALLAVGSVGLQGMVIAMVILQRRASYAVRLAWILLALVMPVVGAFLYLRFGRVKPRLRSPAQLELVKSVTALAQAAPRPPGDALEIPHLELRKGSALVEAVGGLSPSGGNRLRLFATTRADDDCTDALRLLAEDIDHARSSCHLLFYIYLEDSTGWRIGEALERAARRGVACRLLVDALGSRPFLRSRLCRRLRSAGVLVQAALPVNPLRALYDRFDHRNHRKIAVLDGRVGWTGSQNLADPSFAIKARYAPWIDLMIRLEGPGVHDLQRIFAEDWLLEAGGRAEELLTPRPAPFADGVAIQILPTGPTLGVNAMREISLLGFLETDEELILTTPYFVPDDPTAAALLAIARSGVRAVLVVPKGNDSRLVAAASRSYYDALLEAGVEVYEFRNGLLHAKTFSFDGRISMVATANLDRRSYELNYEVSVLVADPGFTAQLREVQLSYVAQSERIDPRAWLARPFRSRMWENTAGLLSPLL